MVVRALYWERAREEERETGEERRRAARESEEGASWLRGKSPGGRRGSRRWQRWPPGTATQLLLVLNEEDNRDFADTPLALGSFSREL
jgi:hypothetical protein